MAGSLMYYKATTRYSGWNRPSNSDASVIGMENGNLVFPQKTNHFADAC